MTVPTAPTQALKTYIHLDGRQVNLVDDFMFERRLRHRVEAIRQLMQLGIEAAQRIDDAAKESH